MSDDFNFEKRDGARRGEGPWPVPKNTAPSVTILAVQHIAPAPDVRICEVEDLAPPSVNQSFLARWGRAAIDRCFTF